MSYLIGPRVTGEILRMPLHFGLAAGPRQDLEGNRHDTVTSPDAVSAWVRFAADADWVAHHLPPGFEPAAVPDLTFEVRNLTNISWLAGRGYSIVTVATAARWVGGDEPLDGRFQLVLWENQADPIITGREEVGYSKMFADITDIERVDDSASATASWFGFPFLRLRVDELRPIDVTDSARQMPSGPGFHWKYIPKTGTWGEADASYPVVTPTTGGSRVVTEALAGTGTVVVERATWEQLPTLVHIVNTLADLELGDCLSAGLTRSTGHKDLRDQAELRFRAEEPTA